MVLKIERITQDGQTVLRLSGRLNANELDQVRAEISALNRKTSLDLGEIALVDMEAIRFLAECELRGRPCFTVHFISGNGSTGNGKGSADTVKSARGSTFTFSLPVERGSL